MSAPETVKNLVLKFARNITQYKSSSYNETETRIEFLNPFWKELGWDVDNEAGYAINYRDVIHEDCIKLRGGRDTNSKAPDYAFRIGGVRKFFLEAKKPSVDIRADISPAYQLRCYGWSCGLALSVLSDFEEFAVYDCRVRPKNTDRADTARIRYLTYEQYVDCWDEIAGIFHRENILRGSFDRFINSRKSKAGTSEVDDEFLREIEDWRLILARDLAKNNPELDVRTLNFTVQRTIDRLIFLRMAEDRGIEPEDQLWDLIQKPDIYANLLTVYRAADDKYNSGFFHFSDENGQTEAPDTLTPALNLSDRALSEILKRVYPPVSPYRFDVLPVEILGNVYERFLGNIIRLTPARQVKVEEKPEVKKANGVFYTPPYIVNYIVENTVGKLCEGKTPREVSSLKILDPACGSGSFLLGAYKFLMDWHLKYYLAEMERTGKIPQSPPSLGTRKKKSDPCALCQSAGGEWRLTLSERKRILLNNIYGVDLDAQAVEVTKLSLSLSVLEGFNEEVLDSNRRLFYERALPNLSQNIRCGNSLIGPDYYLNSQSFLSPEFQEEQYTVNAFDWRDPATGFGEIMREGGFDAVIGNPPYVRQEILGEKFKEYAQSHYKTFAGTADLFTYFIEKGVSLLRENGLYSVIVSNKWMLANYGTPLRRWLKEQCVEEIIDFGDLPVFKGATTYPQILRIRRVPSAGSFDFRKVETLDFLSLSEYLGEKRFQVETEFLDDNGWNLAPRETQILLKKIMERGMPLGEYVHGEVYYGIKTGLNEAFVIDAATRARLIAEDPNSEKVIKPFLAGRDVKRYGVLKPDKYLILFPKGLTNQFASSKQSGKRWLETTYPAIAKHLEPFLKRAEARCDKGDYWWELRACDYYDDFELPKIIYPNICKRPEFTLDLDGNYANQKTFIIPRQDLYLLGILNSRIFQFLFACILPKLRGNFYEPSYVFFKKFPIRPIDFSNPADVSRHDELVQSVENLLMINRRLQTETFPNPRERELLERQSSALDTHIDRLVYALYGLTNEEIRLVEENI